MLTASLITYLIGVILFLLGMMLWQYKQGTVDLISARNIFLLGFIMWQLNSPIILLITRFSPSGVYIQDHDKVGLEFSFLVTLFLLVYLFSYQRGWIVRRLAAKSPMPTAVPGDLGLVLISLCCALAAMALKFGFVIPVFGSLFGQFAEGMSAVGVGLVVIAMFRRKLNPMVMTIAIVVLLIGMGTSVMWTSSRRPLMSVFMAGIWALYYYHWRGKSITRIVGTSAILMVAPAIMLAAFSTIRYAGGLHDTRRLSDHVARLGDVDIKSGLIDLVGGADTASCSFWLIENHPESLEYRHLNTLYYSFIYPIPRTMWPDKPTVMAQDFPRLAGQQGVPLDDFNVGPGVIGSAACEGGLYAVVVYALWLGLGASYLDSLMRFHYASPLAGMIPAAALGQWVALARGETGSFMSLYILAVVGAYVIVSIINKIAKVFGSPTTAQLNASM